MRQEKRLQESGRGFRDGGGCNFRTVKAKAPWSVLETPVAVAAPELCKRGESRGKWCLLGPLHLKLEMWAPLLL